MFVGGVWFRCGLDDVGIGWSCCVVMVFGGCDFVFIW